MDNSNSSSGNSSVFLDGLRSSPFHSHASREIAAVPSFAPGLESGEISAGVFFFSGRARSALPGHSVLFWQKEKEEEEEKL